jgi:hypothetical protein
MNITDKSDFASRHDPQKGIRLPGFILRADILAGTALKAALPVRASILHSRCRGIALSLINISVSRWTLQKVLVKFVRHVMLLVPLK